ncbi:hypothetical protein [Sphingobacterium hungaricum]|uniref:hypothetical protein n=1 Tax=Sphingobacterium hungaricum TaxID=2082723 RepID=UPI0018CB409F|nr:hypothetical protein [Sphingobacterium hungaricum]
MAVVIGLSSCNQKTNSKDECGSGRADTSQVKAELKGHSDFNLDQVLVSQQEVGDFPYLSAPSGYRHGDDKEKTLEEKYFFHKDSLIQKISGKYFHTAVYQEGDVFEDTYVVNEYKKAIENLGGVEVYSGGLPSTASDLIEKEKPAYVSDMYDPSPYKYKQFLIRTPNENIWIELCHGLNANQIDLTVLREEVLKETIQ